MLTVRQPMQAQSLTAFASIDASVLASTKSTPSKTDSHIQTRNLSSHIHMYTHAGSTLHNCELSPFDLTVNACRGPVIEYSSMCTKFGVGSSSCTDTHTDTPSCRCYCLAYPCISYGQSWYECGSRICSCNPSH